MGVLSGRTIVLGVSGGIAAYKSAELVRLLVTTGANVRVMMTRNATAFITPLTLPTLSGIRLRQIRSRSRRNPKSGTYGWRTVPTRSCSRRRLRT